MDLDRALLAEAAGTDVLAEALDADTTDATTSDSAGTTPPGTTTYVRGVAEHLPFPADAFDVVTAGQCWHWFERDRAAREIRRVLRPGGTLVITHFDWLPREGNVVAATED